MSVFEDNAGVVRFDDRFNIAFKVETHNHPSALEPYGGANTGVGGVIRDIMGTGPGGQADLQYGRVLLCAGRTRTASRGVPAPDDKDRGRGRPGSLHGIDAPPRRAAP